MPAAVGIGSYNVNANFVAGGGLYQNANVTYRGVTVGRVESVGLSNDGVVAHMRLNSGTPVPENVTATVKSVSAVGEQYIDLVPPDDAVALDAAQRLDHRPSAHPDRPGHLRAADRGRRAGQQRRQQPAAGSAARNVQGVQRIRTGTGAADPVVAAAWSTRRTPTTDRSPQLIDQAGPFLDAQIRSGDDIKSLAEGLARFTGEVANADPQLRSVLQNVPGATAAANTTFEGIRPTFPVLAANLANFGRIGVIYRKSLEQALVIFPALMAALITVGGGVPADEGGKLDFKIDLQDPPPCSTGFIPPPEIRSPADTTLRELPTDLYCKTATERSRAWCAARATTRARSSRASGHRRFSSAATRRDTCRSAATRGAVRRCRTAHRSRIRG